MSTPEAQQEGHERAQTRPVTTEGNGADVATDPRSIYDWLSSPTFKAHVVSFASENVCIVTC